MSRFSTFAIGFMSFLAVLFAGVSLAQDSEIAVPERGLQTELEPRTADDDWRAEVGLRTPTQGDPIELPDFLDWILANLFTILVYLIPVALLAVIIMVLVRQGAGGGFRWGAEAAAGERAEEGGVIEDPLLGGEKLGLDEIIRLEDLDAALGALLRLVLEAAIALSGHVLKRSATAREILRRLPSDFAHLAAVATLVREAERVRYGGQPITRERFDELVGLVRPLLGRGAAS